MPGASGKNSQHCCAPNCKNIYYLYVTDPSYRNKSFFRITAEREMIWTESVRKLCKPDFNLTNKNGFFCEDHFELQCFRNIKKNSLNKFAVPTIFYESNTTSSSLNSLNSDICVETTQRSVEQFVNETLQNAESNKCQTSTSEDFSEPSYKKPKYTYSKLPSANINASSGTITVTMPGEAESNSSCVNINTSARCAVFSCNSTSKAGDKNIIFHSFPIPEDVESKNIRLEWIKRCTRQDEFNPDICRICSLHFVENDYECDLQNELLGLPLKRILKKTAVPTLRIDMTRATVLTEEKRFFTITRRKYQEVPEIINDLLINNDFNNDDDNLRIEESSAFVNNTIETSKQEFIYEKKYKELLRKYNELQSNYEVLCDKLKYYNSKSYRNSTSSEVASATLLDNVLTDN